MSDTWAPRGRSRGVLVSGVSAIASKTVTTAAGLVAVPLALHYLGVEKYGVWLTLTSILALSAFADLGMGNGLVNAISYSLGMGEVATVRRHMSTAVGVFACLGLFVAAVGTLIVLLLPAGSRLMPKAVPVWDVKLALLFLVFLFAASLPLSTTEKARLAHQRNYQNSLWQGVGAVFGLGFLALAVGGRASFPLTVLAGSCGALLGLLPNTVLFYTVSMPGLRPALRLIRLSSLRAIARPGGMFFVLQLCAVVAYQTDNIVIAGLRGAAAVPDYAVTLKLFGLFPLILSYFLLPTWPAYSEALVRKEFAWIKRTFKRTLLLAAALNLPGGILLVVFGRQIIAAWAGPELHPSRGLLLAAGIFIAINTLGGPLATLFSSANVIKFQLVTAVAMASVNLALSIWLVGRLGAVGALWGTVISQVICILIPSLCYLKSFFRSLPNRALSVADPSLLP